MGFLDGGAGALSGAALDACLAFNSERFFLMVPLKCHSSQSWLKHFKSFRESLHMGGWSSVQDLPSQPYGSLWP